ncbi:MAG: hypothetical protein DRJ51_03260 [Thermoprotei archaeon]|nr:MAG: hypothetical protein DRJ51_03260 [Thermoprotei archaeon]RLF03249.1 MAG: hypothetical protein DRJ59_01190 [Thermoprotei archaeon]HDN17724.1 hypothetical protein [Candidatus Bathyarchaeota archaeon]
MVKVKWYRDIWIPLEEDIKRRVEEQIGKMDLEKVRGFREYEETGDEYILPEPNPYEGLFVKVVKHEGKLMVVAGQWEHGGYVEEYYVGEVVEESAE